MDDRTLLELAARAAGVKGTYVGPEDWPDWLLSHDGEGIYITPSQAWNPLMDDGDALRLAVKLSLHVQIDFDGDQDLVYVFGDWYGGPEAPREPKGSDPCAAVRRAIVRAAAIMGDPGIRRAAIGQQEAQR